MSQSKMAIITFLDNGPVDPGYGVSAPVYPSQGLPGSGINYPSQGLPPGAVQLPVFPFDPTIPSQGLPPTPDQSLPGGSGGRPSQGLPGAQPGIDNTLPGSPARPSNELPSPGRKYVVKWLACVGLILVPDNSLPSGSGRPDQTLPPTPEPKSPK